MCIAGFSLNASILILLVPTLFRSDRQVDPLAVAGLVALCVGFAVGVGYWRPQVPSSDPG